MKDCCYSSKLVFSGFWQLWMRDVDEFKPTYFLKKFNSPTANIFILTLKSAAGFSVIKLKAKLYIKRNMTELNLISLCTEKHSQHKHNGTMLWRLLISMVDGRWRYKLFKQDENGKLSLCASNTCISKTSRNSFIHSFSQHLMFMVFTVSQQDWSKFIN